MTANFKKIIAGTSIVLSSLAFVSPAFAAAPDGNGPWADSVFSVSQGLMKNGLAVPAPRSNPSAALGVAENDTVEPHFFSLGFGGNIALGFDNGISSGVIVVEATNPGYPGEQAKVEVSENGTTWVNAGTITQDGTVNKPAGISCAKYVRLTDVSDKNIFSDATADGFDVDGVQATGDPCTPPTPPCNNNCGCVGGDITQVNSSTIITSIGSSANTGNNKANKNTGGTTNITTGNASSSATVSVTGSTNTVTGNGCCPGGSTHVTISGNGAGSHNSVNINSPKKPQTLSLIRH